MDTIKIIIADDHSLFRKGIMMALKDRNDIEFVGEAGNGSELLLLLKTITPDIILLNVTMPVMNGPETLPKIRRRHPGLRVIMESMNTDPKIVAACLRMGAVSYLSKNSDSATIYQAIKITYIYGFYYSDTIHKAISALDPSLIPTGTESGSTELSAKEKELLDLLNQNIPLTEIAEDLDVSERTIEAMKDNIKRKTDSMNQSGDNKERIQNDSIQNNSQTSPKRKMSSSSKISVSSFLRKAGLALLCVIILMIILNPGIGRFREFGGDSSYNRREYNFLIFSIYQNAFSHKEYLGIFMNFFPLNNGY